MLKEWVKDEKPSDEEISTRLEKARNELAIRQMKVKEKNLPVGNLAKAIEDQCGSFDKFVSVFEAKGAGLFGSGWVWLACDAKGQLQILQEPNAGNPLTKGLTPLLTFDVWEHAYYLDYQNRRPGYISALWQIIDWNEIERRYNDR